MRGRWRKTREMRRKKQKIGEKDGRLWEEFFGCKAEKGRPRGLRKGRGSKRRGKAPNFQSTANQNTFPATYLGKCLQPNYQLKICS